jgi:hypothetical protein
LARVRAEVWEITVFGDESNGDGLRTNVITELARLSQNHSEALSRCVDGVTAMSR